METTKRLERGYLRWQLLEIRDLEVEAKRAELERIGIDPYDFPMAIEEVYKITIRYDTDLRKLQELDDQEDYRAAHPWPY